MAEENDEDRALEGMTLEELERIEDENDKREPKFPTRTAFLDDEAYVDHRVRINEWSLDGITSTIGTLVRISLNFLEYGQRFMGMLRRWVPVDFYYGMVKKVELVQEPDVEESDYELDEGGRKKPVIVRMIGDKEVKKGDEGYDEADEFIKKDKLGNVVYELKSGKRWRLKVVRRETEEYEWIPPADLVKTGLFDRDKWEKYNKLVRLERKHWGELRFEDEDKKKYRDRIRALRRDLERDEDNEEKPVEGYVNRVKKERKWFLSQAHAERNVQRPREGFVKMPKQYFFQVLHFLKEYQKAHKKLVVTDIYAGKYPGKLARDRNGKTIRFLDPKRRKFFVECPGYGKAGIRLGDLDISELTYLAQLWYTRNFYSAKVRWHWFQKIRHQVITYFNEEEGRPPKNTELEGLIEGAYDWWIPFCIVDYVRNMMTDSVYHGSSPDPADPNADILQTRTAAERADSRFNAVNLISHVERYPVPNGEDTIDESNALVIIPVSEEVLDLGRCTGLFQQGKSLLWKYEMFACDDRAVELATSRDWGGPRSSDTWGGDPVYTFTFRGETITVCEGDWRFMVVYDYVQSIKPEDIPEDATEEQKRDYKRAMRDWRRERRTLLGNLRTRKPGDVRPAEPALFGDFGGRRADMTAGAKFLRGNIALGREGSTIRWMEVVKEILPKLRRHERGELGILQQETLWWRDSYHVGKIEKGLRADNMVQGLQGRIDGPYRDEDDEALIQLVNVVEMQRTADITDPNQLEAIRQGVMPDDYTPANQVVEIDFFNQTAIMRQLWLKQPFGKARDAILYQLREQIKHNVPHIRPGMKRVFEGLPPKFNPLIRQIWHLSDIRFRRMVATVRSHGIGGIRGLDFGTINKAVDEGYGQGYDSIGNQFRRVMSMMELPLWNKYGDRIRGYVEAYTGAHSTWSDYRDFTNLVGSDLRSRNVNLDAMRIALGFLKMFGVIPADWLIELRNDHRVLQMENWFALLEGRLLSDHLLIDDEGNPVTREREIDGKMVQWPVYGSDGEELIDMIEQEGIYQETPLEETLLIRMHSGDPDRPEAALLLEEPGGDAPAYEMEAWRQRMSQARYAVEDIMYQELA